MNDKQETLAYQVYLLRLWQERTVSSNRPAVWRFSLEDTRLGQRRGFGSLEDLLSFLQEQLKSNND